MLNKPAYIKMCTLEVKYQCVNSILIISRTNIATNEDYYSQILTAKNEIETENVDDNFCKNKEMFDFTYCSTKSKYDD